jgi:Kef-type K+ transport system membrane component KefB
MNGLTVEWMLIIVSGMVVMSYFYSVISKFIRIPSVLLLLFTGVCLRILADSTGTKVTLPDSLVQLLGIVGLVMIILEAGLDLKLKKEKLSLIRNTFFSALVILLASSFLIAYMLEYFLSEPFMKCLVYAIPLSIMSSSIVIPSIHNLTERKKEFLVYEASFSDILGIMFFNFLTASSTITLASIGGFLGSLLISIILSIVFSILLFIILVRSTVQIKFFLVFALLVAIYVSGKLLHLPSLLVILVFGLFINNLESVRFDWFKKMFPEKTVKDLQHLLHTITAESSFLIRTFFFIIFGFSITLGFLENKEVLVTGGLVVLTLFVVRFLYLRFFLKTNVFPESFFIPRGLITIVLFYKIPPEFRLESFDDDILFFVILVTGLIMTTGMIFYKKPSSEIVEEGNFLDREDIS